MKLVLTLLTLLVTTSPRYPDAQGSDPHQNLQEEGNTKIGADAAETGTDLSDQDVQAQEDKIDDGQMSPQLPQDTDHQEGLEVDENK